MCCISTGMGSSATPCAYIAPLIVAGMGGMQSEGIAMEGVRRGVAALDDLDTVAFLQKSL